MRFGVCASIAKADVAYRAGFDYIECQVNELQPLKSDKEVQAILRQYEQSPLPVEAFNIFVPSELKVTGKVVEHDRIKRFVQTALERVHRVGGKTIVFGSGGARKLPESFSYQKGEEQIASFLDMVADVADPLGITIVIEPLFKKASNIIHTVPDAVQMARRVNRESIQVLADFFHMMEEDDDLDNIATFKQYIKHIHVSDNYYPPGTGQYPFPRFVEAVRKANYNSRISIECIWDDFDNQVTDALQYVKKQFA